MREILPDLNFKTGFVASLFHSNSSNGKKAGVLDYNGKSQGEPVWQLAQWGCTKDISKDAVFTDNGDIKIYDDGGKYLKVDTSKKGCFTIGIKGSVEYTLDDKGNIRERTDKKENFPHILVEQEHVETDISPDAKHLYMELDYKVTKLESKVDRKLYPAKKAKNAATFQWYLRLEDTDPNSKSKGSTMWFGISTFDNRRQGKNNKGYKRVDGGKEDSTGCFIYNPTMKRILKMNAGVIDSTPTSVVGKEIKYKIDVLPLLQGALRSAQLHGAMKGTNVKHLKIVSTNIGWEIPGNYDVEAEIYSMNVIEE